MARKQRTRFDYDGQCSLCGGVKVWCATGGCASCTTPPTRKERADTRKAVRARQEAETEERRRRLVEQRAQEIADKREKTLANKARNKERNARVALKLIQPDPLPPAVAADAPQAPPPPPKDRYAPFTPEEAKLPECRLMVKRVMKGVQYTNMERIYE